MINDDDDGHLSNYSKKNVSAGNRRDSFIKDIFKKKKNQLEQQKSPWKRKNYPNLPSQNSFRSLQEIIQNGVLTLCFLCFNCCCYHYFPLTMVKCETSRLYDDDNVYQDVKKDTTITPNDSNRR